MEIHFNGFISQSLAHYNNYIVYNDVIIQSYMHYTFLVQDRECCQERENQKEIEQKKIYGITGLCTDFRREASRGIVFLNLLKVLLLLLNSRFSAHQNIIFFFILLLVLVVLLLLSGCIVLFLLPQFFPLSSNHSYGYQYHDSNVSPVTYIYIIFSSLLFLLTNV